MENYTMKIDFQRQDGTFVGPVNGMPYHYIPSDTLFAEAQKAGAKAPFEPLPPEPTIEERREMMPQSARYRAS